MVIELVRERLSAEETRRGIANANRRAARWRKKVLGQEVVLEEVDLTACSDSNHPGIEFGPQYLACLLVNGRARLVVGTFSKQWYGPNFDMGGWGMQYDPPGQNCSDWLRLWRIHLK